MTDWLLISAVIALAVFWGCAVLWLMAKLSGWRALATIYAEKQRPDGPAYRFQSGFVGPVSYGSCLSIRTSSAGLYLSVFSLLRPAHPPLFIPWFDLTYLREKRTFFLRLVEFSVGTPVIATIALPAKVVQKAIQLYNLKQREPGGAYTTAN